MVDAPPTPSTCSTGSAPPVASSAEVGGDPPPPLLHLRREGVRRRSAHGAHVVAVRITSPSPTAPSNPSVGSAATRSADGTATPSTKQRTSVASGRSVHPRARASQRGNTVAAAQRRPGMRGLRVDAALPQPFDRGHREPSRRRSAASASTSSSSIGEYIRPFNQPVRGGRREIVTGVTSGVHPGTPGVTLPTHSARSVGYHRIQRGEVADGESSTWSACDRTHDELAALIELRCRLGEDPWAFLARACRRSTSRSSRRSARSAALRAVEPRPRAGLPPCRAPRRRGALRVRAAARDRARPPRAQLCGVVGAPPGAGTAPAVPRRRCTRIQVKKPKIVKAP